MRQLASINFALAAFPASVGYHGWLSVRRLAARIAGEQPAESD